ncbi:ATP-dependent helicase [Cellulomonas sp. Marseille-Q8402]
MNPTLTAPPSGGALRLVRPALADVPAPVRLGADQRAVVERLLAGGDPALLVVGAAGTGKTLLAVEAVAAALGADDDALFAPPDLPRPDEVLVLASGRRAAAELRDRIGGRVRRTTGQAMVRTAASAAFAVLRARAGLLGEPAPTLISGPEQDLALAELLAGHAAGDGVPLRWPAGVPDEALTLRAFRGELRDLLMRAAERGLVPEDLALLGERHGRPEWVSAAALYEEYLDVTTLRTGTPDAGARLDPAVVVEEAAEALRAWDAELPGRPRPRWRLVVVDDYQEATEATARLLRVLQDDGARLLLLADPDAAVQTFRGATPALVGRADVHGDGPGELGAHRMLLDGVRRHGPALRAVTARVAERVAVVGGAAHRRALPVTRAGGVLPTPADAGAHAVPRDLVRAAVLPSAAQEAAWVAHALRRAHLEDGTPWAEMAVIARSGGQVTALRRALGSAQVPVAVVGSDVPLRDEPAVRPLLDALRCALGPDGGGAALDAELAARLCLSPLGGLDAVGLRRLRRGLRSEEVAAGGGRPSDELLVEVLGLPARAAALPAGVRRPVTRLATVLAEGRAAATAPGADAQSVLWAIWDASGLVEPWRRAALAGGPGGARADRDLDAVLALFRAAETFVDRMPQARAAAFLEWVEAQELPSDTIAARASRDAVSVLTPAGAAGREWDVVAVAGVQEGVWPDLRLRDSLLGSQALVDVLSGRGAPSSDRPADGAAARAAVLADELRSFHVAVSRARRVLLVTAVSDEDDQPSPFLDLVEPHDEDDDPRRAVAPAPLDLRGLVAQLRGRLEQSARDGGPDGGAAAVLARLADEGVPGADPAEWHGLADPSSDDPLWAPGERVTVSPSRVETAGTCTLRWALEAAGGTAPSSARQSLGTLVHALAQTHPRGGREALLAELDRRWPELGLGNGWPATLERRRAEAMVGRLADYLATAGEPLAVEARFELELERAVVRGTLDRVERADVPGADVPGADVPGADVPGDAGTVPVRVVDLKTGRSAPSAQEAQTNPQLGAYQLAVDAGAVEGLPPEARSAGAQLVYVSDVNKARAALRAQPAIGPESPQDPSWARAHIEEVAERMAASSFAATVNPLCDRCPVRRSCPLRDEGGQVVG